MATETALAISELLQCVLLEVPPKQLFVLQAVSKTWKSAIEASILLRKKMFLAPEGVVQKAMQRDVNQPTNPSHTRCLRPEYETATFSVAPIFTPLSTDEIYAMKLPPAHDRYSYRAGRRPGHFYSITWTKKLGTIEIFSSSIRHMLVTQPPLEAMYFTVCNGSSYPFTTATIYDTTGIKIGSVLDTFHKILENMPPLDTHPPYLRELELSTQFVSHN